MNNKNIVLEKNLTIRQVERWKKQFGGNNSNFILEGIWRRTQVESNKKKSGWRGPQDRRRRMLQYLDKYSLAPNGSGRTDLIVVSPYIWLNIVSPKNEILGYLKQIHEGARQGRWQSLASGRKNQFTYRNDRVIP
ncbi:MAG: hypothetical protein ABID04_03585 [Patescibacteria group bacterium]